MASLHKRIKDAIAVIISGLDLTDLAGGIENLTIADESNIQYPCVMLTIGDPEDVRNGDTAHVHKTFPVRVLILDRDAQFPADEDKYLSWRERMMAQFNNPPTGAPFLAGATEVFQLEVVPKAVVEETFKELGKIMDGFTIRATASIQRGTG